MGNDLHVIPGDPRNGHRYRTNVTICLTLSDLCHLCGHHGAETADHVIPVDVWWKLYGTWDGVNDLTNLLPAHGTKGRVNNRCTVCGLMCNQRKGARTAEPGIRSREW